MFLAIEFCEVCRKPIKSNENNVKISIQDGKGFFNTQASIWIHVRCMDDGKHTGYSRDEALETLESIVDVEDLRGMDE